MSYVVHCNIFCINIEFFFFLNFVINQALFSVSSTVQFTCLTSPHLAITKLSESSLHLLAVFPVVSFSAGVYTVKTHYLKYSSRFWGSIKPIVSDSLIIHQVKQIKSQSLREVTSLSIEKIHFH